MFELTKEFLFRPTRDVLIQVYYQAQQVIIKSDDLRFDELAALKTLGFEEYTDRFDYVDELMFTIDTSKIQFLINKLKQDFENLNFNVKVDLISANK